MKIIEYLQRRFGGSSPPFGTLLSSHKRGFSPGNQVPGCPGLSPVVPVYGYKNSYRPAVASFLVVFLILGACLAGAGEAKKFGPYTEAEVLEILRKAYVDWQGDKSEKLVLLADDGQVFTFAGSNQSSVSISLVGIIRTLARKEVSIWQVTDIFHNHNNPRDGFSATDEALFESLRKAGIKAGFHVFYPETRRIKTLERAD